jgi:hypothetical protein
MTTSTPTTPSRDGGARPRQYDGTPIDFAAVAESLQIIAGADLAFFQAGTRSASR